jgi:hypothetical protein
MNYPPGEASALDWSISAMVETIDRLPRVKVWDGARAVTVIGEAVWWVTIVDATMVRYHPDTYDQILAEASAEDRTTIEESLAGLRYVRNHMGHDIDHVDFVMGTPRSRGRAADRIANWIWRPLPQPCLTTLSPSARDWEMGRYRAYQGRLAEHVVGEAFSRARVFLADVATTAEPDKLGVWAN